MKVEAHIHSLKDEEHNRHVLGEAEIIRRIGDNLYLAVYNGVRCTAIFNPLVGRYFVDDVYGIQKERANVYNLSPPKTFKVVITETLKLTVEIEAGDPYEAEQIASARWHNSEYILDSENFASVDFEASSIGDDENW